MITVELQSKPPHDTFWLEVTSDAKLPLKFIADLDKAGWIKSHEPEPVDGLVKVQFASPGTGIDNSWTEIERRIKITALKKFVDSIGIKLSIRRFDA